MYLIEDNQGIDISSLKRGTILKIRTKNSTYCLFILKDNYVLIQGGKHFPKATRARFDGSTWGGPLIKRFWIGYEMKMEFAYEINNGLYTVVTSGVQTVHEIHEDIIFTHQWGIQDDIS